MLGPDLEGLQYEVGLVDEPICAVEDVYRPGNRRQQCKAVRTTKMAALKAGKAVSPV